MPRARPIYARGGATAQHTGERGEHVILASASADHSVGFAGIEWWMIGAAASLILATAYLAIASTIGRGLYRSGQAFSNPLGLATAAIFLSCGIAHSIHGFHALEPSFGITSDVGHAARVAYSDWHVWGWEVVTAGVAITYWSLRKRFHVLIRGTALFDDFRQRQTEALDIHDSVVQGLAQAKLNFELGRHDEGMRGLDETLAASRAIITKLLGPSDSPVATERVHRRDRPAEAPR